MLLITAGLLLAAWSNVSLALCQPQPDCENTNVAPTVTLTAPSNGATSVAPGSFALTANATDTDGTIDSVEFFSNNVSIGIDSSAPYSMSYGGLAVGSYAIKAKATDDGGKSNMSSTATVTVTAATNVAPSITLTSPANGATAAAPGSFVISASASDSDGSISSVKFKSGTTVLYTDTTYPYSYTYAGVAAGSYALSAMATDNGGATATSSMANVTVSSSSNTPPAITLTAPSNGATVAALSAITLSATASDSNGSIANVKFLANGAVVNTDTAAPFAYSYYTATPGSVAIQAIATDNGGASATSATATITVTAPAPVTQTRTYVYDTNERLCKTINSESGATLVDYDAAGNIAWTAEGTTLTSTTCDRASVTAGQKTVRSYDAMNRLIAVSTPGGTADVTTTYYADGAVNTVTAANPGGFNVTTTYTYNKRRLLTAETATNGVMVFPLSYGYTANGHLSSITYPDTQTVNYNPDGLGRAQTVAAASGTTYASNISYFPNGAISGFTYGNGIVHTMEQNARRLPTRSRDLNLDLNDNIVATILDDTYDFDENGNVSDITDQAQSGLTTRGMAYDGLDRLTSAVSPGQWGTANYTYDALDNLRSAVQGTRQYRYDYHATTRRLSTIKNPAGTTLFTLGYDVRGNTTSKNTQAYVFDAANRMSQVTGKQTYRYDGQGRRVQTTDSDGKTTFWIYSQSGQVMYTSEARRSQNLSYVYLGNTQIATRAVAWAPSNAVSVRYEHTDALGSPVAETDEQRTVTKRNSYAPFGETFAPAVIDGTGYTGHVMDQATGLTYMQQRYYDPAIGRFFSTDPASAGFNAYNYANNSPYRFTDPDGRAPAGYQRDNSWSGSENSEPKPIPKPPNGCLTSRKCWFDGTKWHTSETWSGLIAQLSDALDGADLSLSGYLLFLPKGKFREIQLASTPAITKATGATRAQLAQAKILAPIAGTLSGLTVAWSGYNFYQAVKKGDKADAVSYGANTAVGVYGLRGGPVGAVAGTVYGVARIVLSTDSVGNSAIYMGMLDNACAQTNGCDY